MLGKGFSFVLVKFYFSFPRDVSDCPRRWNNSRTRFPGDSGDWCAWFFSGKAIEPKIGPICFLARCLLRTKEQVHNCEAAGQHRLRALFLYKVACETNANASFLYGIFYDYVGILVCLLINSWSRDKSFTLIKMTMPWRVQETQWCCNRYTQHAKWNK